MRKIIIPTDFSENAWNALQYAVELFKFEHCDINLLHAFAEQVYNNEEVLTQAFLEELRDSIQIRAEKTLGELLQKIEKYSPNPRHTFKTKAGFGFLVDEINELVNTENIDVVVMGVRGKTKGRHLSFGSNTLQVIKYVQSPVLCIPENFQFRIPENILFPTNYMIPYQRRELELIAEIARKFQANIHMLYISKFPLESFRQKDNQASLKKVFREIKLKSHWMDATDKTTAIMDQIALLKINILVMVNSRHTYLEDILYESKIAKMSLFPKIPFLVLQNYHRNIL